MKCARKNCGHDLKEHGLRNLNFVCFKCYGCKGFGYEKDGYVAIPNV